MRGKRAEENDWCKDFASKSTPSFERTMGPSTNAKEEKRNGLLLCRKSEKRVWGKIFDRKVEKARSHSLLKDTLEFQGRNVVCY